MTIINSLNIKEKLQSYINKKISLDNLTNWAFKCISSDETGFDDKCYVSEIIHFLDDEFTEVEAISYAKQLIKFIDNNGNYEDFIKITSS